MKSTAEIDAQSLRIAGLRDRYAAIAARRDRWRSDAELSDEGKRLLNRAAAAALGDYMAAISEK